METPSSGSATRYAEFGLIQHCQELGDQALIVAFPQAQCGFLAGIFIRIVQTPEESFANRPIHIALHAETEDGPDQHPRPHRREYKKPRRIDCGSFGKYRENKGHSNWMFLLGCYSIAEDQGAASASYRLPERKQSRGRRDLVIFDTRGDE